MKLSVCSISFRHYLISLEQIAHWASRNKFDSIELWGVHAKNMLNFPEYDREWLATQNLSVSMVSDYLQLDGDLDTVIDSTKHLCRLTSDWGAKKLRTFSGNKSSADVAVEERKAWTKQLRELCCVADDYGLKLVVETHPNTLADTLSSTLQLVEEINHPALAINFDVIHVWEMGSDPIVAFKKLEPLIAHIHLKNITDRSLFDVFAPNNVYAPAGSRNGMTPLFEGAYDFKDFLNFVMAHSPKLWEKTDASLEWFGHDVISNLKNDSSELSNHQMKFNQGFLDNRSISNC